MAACAAGDRDLCGTALVGARWEGCSLLSPPNKKQRNSRSEPSRWAGGVAPGYLCVFVEWVAAGDRARGGGAGERGGLAEGEEGGKTD